MNRDTVLRRVSKPGRYSGGEIGEVIKDKNTAEMRVAFCFPDIYDIGMSNLGMRILCGVLNCDDRIWCERVFMPWTDMMQEMKNAGMLLSALESGDPLTEFDMVGITLQYELCYSNAVMMLRLAGIPLRASERGEEYPVILGGGPCAYNPEPVADFFDIFSIGEGEEALPELCDLYMSMKKDGSYTKKAFLRRAAKLDGFYVPSLYSVSYNEDGTIASFAPVYEDVPQKITKRLIKDLDKVFYPEKPLLPYIETVQDRIVLETNRGCIRGCRFCQAGMTNRPVREKTPEVLDCQARELYGNTGYDEISMCSLSISDYSRIGELTDRLLSWTDAKKVSISLPSLRVDSFTKELMDKISGVRTSGLTFAPEAGTQRLRDVINKNVCEEDLLRAVNVAFSAGKTSVKLYFMSGLPTETREDIKGISELALHVLDTFYKNQEKNRKKPPLVTVSVSCFIPKPFTPFQWDPQDTLDSLREKQMYLAENITDRKIRYNWHDAKVSRIEAVFARGDRRLSDVFVKACDAGICFDAWDEYFDYERWLSVFGECGIDPAFYANREFGEKEILPWDMIDCGVTKEFLLRERRRSKEGKTTPSCRETCSGCGANKLGGERRCCP